MDGGWALVAAISITVVVVAGVAAANLSMRRAGYHVPGTTVVRCDGGHLFTTLWIEGGRKAVRVGPALRYQWCPACLRWATIRPVKDTELTDEQRRAARAVSSGRF